MDLNYIIALLLHLFLSHVKQKDQREKSEFEFAQGLIFILQVFFREGFTGIKFYLRVQVSKKLAALN